MCDSTLYDVSVGVCQICGKHFDPENYLVVDGTMTMPEKSPTYYTICPDCTTDVDVWVSEDSIEIASKKQH